MLAEIGAMNAQLAPEGLGPIGAVVAPVFFDPALDLFGARGVFLAPGVGVQGASSDDVARVFASCRDRVIPSVSRSLLATGPEIDQLRVAVANIADEFRSKLVI